MKTPRALRIAKYRKPKPVYFVRDGDGWIKCRVAVEAHKATRPQPSGWLHYELEDGTVGLAQPKNWRQEELPQNKGNK
jgi:hypothetical protein